MRSRGGRRGTMSVFPEVRLQRDVKHILRISLTPKTLAWFVPFGVLFVVVSHLYDNIILKILIVDMK